MMDFVCQETINHWGCLLHPGAESVFLAFYWVWWKHRDCDRRLYNYWLHDLTQMDPIYILR